MTGDQRVLQRIDFSGNRKYALNISEVLETLSCRCSGQGTSWLHYFITALPQLFCYYFITALSQLFFYYFIAALSPVILLLFRYCVSTVVSSLFYRCTSTAICPSRSVNNSYRDDLMQHHGFRWYHLNSSLALPVGNLGPLRNLGRNGDVKVSSCQLPLTENLPLWSN